MMMLKDYNEAQQSINKKHAIKTRIVWEFQIQENSNGAKNIVNLVYPKQLKALECFSHNNCFVFPTYKKLCQWIKLYNNC